MISLDPPEAQALAATYTPTTALERLNGRNFDTPPPVDAFWSITMYDIPNFYLVNNPIRRYSIGDRTTGTQRASDGSLTIYLQREPPTNPDEYANWLPTPPGDFRPVMRMYEPRSAIIEGTYQLPPIRRLVV